MQPNSLIQAVAPRMRIGQQAAAMRHYSVPIIVGALIIFLALYNLTNYPLSWFDEGSHLHVPKTLVRFGVYADHSSEGFRYYGPTVGVGPTILLPIAAAFELLGVGLLQARLVMVLYLLAAIYAFYRLAHQLGGPRLALVSVALLVSSPGISLLEYGRQVLGEVPGFFFLVTGLGLWFGAWETTGWRRLGLAGVFMGLAMITKNQYLMLLAPALAAAWLANLIYYRVTPQRTFVIPAIVAGACFAFWQLCMLLYLGVATVSENLAAMRTAAAGAALIFSPSLMKQNVQQLLDLNVYLGWLLPVLVYGFLIALPRRREGQQWGILFALVAIHLTWYTFGSVGWLRYAFPSLALASLLVARFFNDLTDGFRFDFGALRNVMRRSAALPQAGQPAEPPSQGEHKSQSALVGVGESLWLKHALNWALLACLTLMIVRPLGQIARQIIFPPFNGPAAMAAYLDEHVPRGALIETWEQEMGFLTDHNYHFPPTLLQNTAIGHIWLGKPSPAQEYTFIQEHWPDYVLVGWFARWTELYPPDLLATHYKLVTTIGEYQLFALDR
jgi:hypothetical protein